MARPVLSGSEGTSRHPANLSRLFVTQRCQPHGLAISIWLLSDSNTSLLFVGRLCHPLGGARTTVEQIPTCPSYPSSNSSRQPPWLGQSYVALSRCHAHVPAPWLGQSCLVLRCSLRASHMPVRPVHTPAPWLGEFYRVLSKSRFVPHLRPSLG